MKNKLMQKVEDSHKRQEIPMMEPGDTLRVHVKIREGDKERLQAYEGVLIARHNSGISETITVRKISFGTGVERIFPLHSPTIDRIEKVRSARVRRSKLYYLRALRGKRARLKERSTR
jgi:large subunit ribosomal protein L19